MAARGGRGSAAVVARGNNTRINNRRVRWRMAGEY
jgi:hypothetical protein